MRRTTRNISDRGARYRCDGVMLAGLGAFSVPGLHLGSGPELAGIAAVLAGFAAATVWLFRSQHAPAEGHVDELDAALEELLARSPQEAAREATPEATLTRR